MDCQEVIQQLSPYVEGRLDKASTRAIRYHVVGCDSCLAKLAQLAEDKSQNLREGKVPPLSQRAKVPKEQFDKSPLRTWFMENCSEEEAEEALLRLRETGSLPD